MKSYELTPGQAPILVSMPHNGIDIPADIACGMTPSALAKVDTDWYMDRVYHFASKLGCYVINPLFSRYVIDLNRPEDNKSLYPGADTTGLCPITQFDSQPIYAEGKEPDDKQIDERVQKYWQPYHQQLNATLNEIRARYGYALLFEAHSIKSVVPRFFEGKLADFNFGNFSDKSCSKNLTELISKWQPSGYTKVVNGRFKGGYITRHYGNPSAGIDSLQLELSQATYMDEEAMRYDEEKATNVISVIEDLFKELLLLTQNMQQK